MDQTWFVLAVTGGVCTPCETRPVMQLSMLRTGFEEICGGQMAMITFALLMRWWFLAISLTQPAAEAADFWELPPIRYSDTEAANTLTKLAADLAAGAREVKGGSALERLKFVLHELRIPEESQVLVFSKTSHQNPLIRPTNPRSLFFSENAYVGYVPGGDIEAIVQDPVLGPVYYLIESGGPGGLEIKRDLSTCASCHATSNTENVPGMLVRSVFPDENGNPLLALGTTLVDHETPLAERWGGYYVTGRSSLPHLGNRTYTEGVVEPPKASDLRDLGDIIDTAKYPRATSDIVALLVLEHQCRTHNLLNAASMQYRRALFLSRVLDPDAKPDSGSAGLVADSMADKIVDCLFFKNEVDPGEGIEGGEDFQKSFEGTFPKTKDGHSLADFKLYGRIFKHRCSYMIYSDAFRDLPAEVNRRVLEKMRLALSGNNPACDWLKSSEKVKIEEILAETLPGWNG